VIYISSAADTPRMLDWEHALEECAKVALVVKLKIIVISRNGDTALNGVVFNFLC